ncbi:MAG: cytochrome c oxidase subunit II [Candidatus Dormibacteraeota bacterium]|nr:cytochrome c oxidase subunit II [Candidatus Dormibacteraeota bacterium]
MSPTRRLVTTLVVVWVALVVVGTAIVSLLSFPPGPASDVSQSVTDTTRLITWLAWPIFTGVVIAIIGGVLVHRRAPVTKVRSAAELRGNPRLAGIWVGTVGAIVLALAIVGTITLSNEEAAEALGLGGRSSGGSGNTIGGHVSDNSPLEVQVIAQQWQFTYRYPSYGGFESAHLVLPQGRPVQFHVTSLDVIHSFWLIALGVKADAVPVHDNTFNIQPNQVGTYRVECAELCGLWHGAMSDNNVQVVTPTAFSLWASQQQAADAPIMKYLPPYSDTYVPDPPAYGS